MRIPVLLAAAFILGCVSLAQAQNLPGQHLLTEAEQQSFNERLSSAFASSERAKIRAEMNQLIQQRKLEQRHKTPENKSKDD